MKQEEIIEVFKYLKSIDVRTMEFFEEMNDHIITSYQNRVNEHQTIKDHLRDVVQPAFGGVKGIQRIMKAQQKLRQKLITKRAWSLLKSYLLSWPTVLITLFITFVIYQLNNIFNPKDVLLWIMMVSVFLPLAIVGTGSSKFYLACKRLKLPYSSSDLNLRIMNLSLLGTSLLNILLNGFGFIVWGSQKNGVDALSAYPVVQVTLCLLFVLYALITLRLFKEKFILKLAPQY